MLPIPWNINPSSGGGGNFTSPIEFREEKKYCDYKYENKLMEMSLFYFQTLSKYSPTNSPTKFIQTFHVSL